MFRTNQSREVLSANNLILPGRLKELLSIPERPAKIDQVHLIEVCLADALGLDLTILLNRVAIYLGAHPSFFTDATHLTAPVVYKKIELEPHQFVLIMPPHLFTCKTDRALLPGRGSWAWNLYALNTSNICKGMRSQVNLGSEKISTIRFERLHI